MAASTLAEDLKQSAAIPKPSFMEGSAVTERFRELEAPKVNRAAVKLELPAQETPSNEAPIPTKVLEDPKVAVPKSATPSGVPPFNAADLAAQVPNGNPEAANATAPKDEPQTQANPAARKHGIAYLGTAAVAVIAAVLQFRKVQKERAGIPDLIEASEKSGQINAEEKAKLLALRSESSRVFKSLLNDMKIMGYLADKGVKGSAGAVRHLAMALGLAGTAGTAAGLGVYVLVTGDVVSPTVGFGSVLSTLVLTPLGLNGIFRKMGHSAAKDK
jgi:hypothetical protein